MTRPPIVAPSGFAARMTATVLMPRKTSDAPALTLDDVIAFGLELEATPNGVDPHSSAISGSDNHHR